MDYVKKNCDQTLNLFVTHLERHRLPATFPNLPDPPSKQGLYIFIISTHIYLISKKILLKIYHLFKISSHSKRKKKNTVKSVTPQIRFQVYYCCYTPDLMIGPFIRQRQLNQQDFGLIQILKTCFTFQGVNSENWIQGRTGAWASALPTPQPGRHTCILLKDPVYVGLVFHRPPEDRRRSSCVQLLHLDRPTTVAVKQRLKPKRTTKNRSCPNVRLNPNI